MTDRAARRPAPGVYRPVRTGNALEDTTARIVQTVRLGLVRPGGVAPRGTRTRRPVRREPRHRPRGSAGTVGRRVARDTARRSLRWHLRRRPRAAAVGTGGRPPAELSDSSPCAASLEPGAAWAARDARCRRRSATSLGAARSGRLARRGGGLPPTRHPAAPHTIAEFAASRRRSARGRQSRAGERVARHLSAAPRNIEPLDLAARGDRVGNSRRRDRMPPTRRCATTSPIRGVAAGFPGVGGRVGPRGTGGLGAALAAFGAGPALCGEDRPPRTASPPRTGDAAPAPRAIRLGGWPQARSARGRSSTWTSRTPPRRRPADAGHGRDRLRTAARADGRAADEPPATPTTRSASARCGPTATRTPASCAAALQRNAAHKPETLPPHVALQSPQWLRTFLGTHQNAITTVFHRHRRPAPDPSVARRSDRCPRRLNSGPFESGRCELAREAAHVRLGPWST